MAFLYALCNYDTFPPSECNIICSRRLLGLSFLPFAFLFMLVILKNAFNFCCIFLSFAHSKHHLVLSNDCSVYHTLKSRHQILFYL